MQVAPPVGPCLLQPPGALARALSRGSSRGESPLAIVNDARDFVSGASPVSLPLRRPSMDRRPSLDANKMPFRSERSISRTGSVSPDPETAPKRLPALFASDGHGPPMLSMEAFRDIKRREHMDSRGSDPGADAGRGRPRRHRSRHGSSGGSASAPCSRGDQVGEPLTPLILPDAPMTEPPHRRRDRLLDTIASEGCGQARQRQMSTSTSSPQLTCATAAEHTPSSGRPPQAPRRSSSRVFREARRRSDTDTPSAECSSVRAAGDLEARSPSCAEDAPMRRAKTETSPAERRRSGSSGAGSRRHVWRPTEGPGEAAGVAAEVPGQVSPASAGYPAEPDVPAIRIQPASLELRLPLAGRSRPPAAAEASPRPPPAQSCLAPATAPPASDADPARATGSEERDFLAEIQCNDTWDAGETISGQQSQATSSRSRPSMSMSCTRGAKGGVMSLSMASQPPQNDAAPLNASMLETLSSPAAVRGSGFSWARGEVLGHGSLGSVYKALDQRTGQIFAVKEVRIDRKLDSDLKFQAALENEISIYKDLSHPHIVSYLGQDTIGSSLCIYLEYMAGGSVAQVLSQFGALDESLVCTYCRELLEGLEYLHTRKPVVLHRDVKGANILVGLDCKVKLSDFGCSKRTADTMSQSLRGSIPWMAPEVIQQTGYGRRSDVWSLGCVAIEMATAKHPWGSFDNPMAAMMRIGMSNMTPPLPDSVSEVCQAFMTACTQRDKNARPHAAELLRHDFIRNALEATG